MIVIKLAVVTLASVLSAAHAAPAFETDAGAWLASELGMDSAPSAAAALAQLKGQKLPSADDMRASIDANLLAQASAIEQKFKAHQLDEGVNDLKRLIGELFTKLKERQTPELVAFYQRIYMDKMLALQAQHKYYEALLDGARFKSQCAAFANGCPQIYLVNELIRSIEWTVKNSEPADALGLAADQVANKSKVKLAQKRARLFLHPDKNMDLNEESNKYVAGLFDQANRTYQSLLV